MFGQKRSCDVQPLRWCNRFALPLLHIHMILSNSLTRANTIVCRIGLKFRNERIYLQLNKDSSTSDYWRILRLNEICFNGFVNSTVLWNWHYDILCIHIILPNELSFPFIIIIPSSISFQSDNQDRTLGKWKNGFSAIWLAPSLVKYLLYQLSLYPMLQGDSNRQPVRI